MGRACQCTTWMSSKHSSSMTTLNSWRWSAHLHLNGKEWFIEAGKWRQSMLRTTREIKIRDQHRPYLTSAAQAYPEGLNEWLMAKATTQNATFRSQHQDNFKRCGKWHNVLKRRRSDDNEEATVRTRVQLTTLLRGQHPELEKEEEPHWGGMINPRKISREMPDTDWLAIASARYFKRTLKNIQKWRRPPCRPLGVLKRMWDRPQHNRRRWPSSSRKISRRGTETGLHKRLRPGLMDTG